LRSAFNRTWGQKKWMPQIPKQRKATRGFPENRKGKGIGKEKKGGVATGDWTGKKEDKILTPLDCRGKQINTKRG